MFAMNRLVCATLVALCCASAASAQPVKPTMPADGAPPEATGLPNAVTPSLPRADVLADPPPANGQQKADERSPLLDPTAPWTPRTPLLPNASPDEPPLRAPLLPISP